MSALRVWLGGIGAISIEVTPCRQRDELTESTIEVSLWAIARRTRPSRDHFRRFASFVLCARRRDRHGARRPGALRQPLQPAPLAAPLSVAEGCLPRNLCGARRVAD